MMTNKDKTGSARQQKRRNHEKAWLKEHGFNSWEQIHTKLMDGTFLLIDMDVVNEKVKTTQKDKQS